MLVGLTGGIGSGKSTVAAMLRTAGLTVVDADAVAREVVEPGSDVLDRIAAHFGDRVIRPDGTLDRAGLARIVFRDDDARAVLEDLTHPAITREVERRHRQARSEDPDAVVVLDHPLLIETGRGEDLDALVVVLASEATRTRRLVHDRGMDPSDVRARMDSQVGDHERRQAATVVIDNDGSLADLSRQVDDLVARLAPPPSDEAARAAGDRAAGDRAAGDRAAG